LYSNKTIAAFGLSVLIAIPLLLIGGLQGWQLYLKHQWKERLEQEAAQTITVAASAIVWKKRGQEIVFEGKMFDVLSYTMLKDSVVLTGVYDEQETKLETFLNTHISHSNSAVSIVQLLFVLQCFAAVISLMFYWSRYSLQKSISLYSIHYSDPFSAIQKPPPRRAAYL
jgi:hypothetical protein